MQCIEYNRTGERDFLKIKSATSKNNIPIIVYYFFPLYLVIFYFDEKSSRNLIVLNKIREINIQYCEKYRTLQTTAKNAILILPR